MTDRLSSAAPRRAAGRPDAPYTLVYDGRCGVCLRLVGVLRRWDRDGDIAVLASQDPSVPGRFPWIAPAAFEESMQLVGPGGRTWSGAAAIERLLDVLPRGRVAASLLRVPVIGRAADRLYRWFARHRRHFGCGTHCEWPGGTPPR